MRKCALLFITIALISASVVLAQGQQPLTRKQIMESADKNRDRKIGRVEFLERMREAFFFVDANKDGFVTMEEYRIIQGADHRRIVRTDRNKDGKLSIDEFPKAVSEDFDAADKTDDGVLEEAEVKAWIAD
jgi:Ca2+-binding EF-hand superfamily protein